jgi:hypothetical protein
MKYFVSACVVAIVLITQMASNNRVGNQSKPNADTAQSKSSRPSPSQPSPNPADKKPARDADKDQNQKVEVVSAPKITIKPDEDWPMVVCTAILTFVGIIGTCAAVKTLKAIRIQAHHMKHHAISLVRLAKAAQNNAEAANLQVKTFISKERARIRIEPGELTISTLDGKFWLAKVTIKIVNLGAMKALPSSTMGALLFSPSSEPQTTNMHGSLVGEVVIIPDHTIDKNVWCLSDVGPETIKAVNDQTVFVHLYGDIKYTDVFGEYTTPFRYIWKGSYAAATGVRLGQKIDTTKTLDGSWEKHGPESENAAT